MAHSSCDRWGGTAAAIVLATALSGCQLLTVPLEWAGQIASFLVSAFGKAAPLAAMAAMARADGHTSEPEPNAVAGLDLARLLAATSAVPHPLESQLGATGTDLSRATAVTLARHADGAEALVIVDLEGLTLDEARRAVRHLAACGGDVRGISLVDGTALQDPCERTALATALASGGTRLVELKAADTPLLR